MRSFIVIVFSLLLLACAMGPDYSRPDIPTSDSFRMAEEPKDLPSLANMPWWELYKDEELQRLVRIALEENKDLKRAVANIDEFQARLYTARVDFAPQFSATGNFPLARTGGFLFPGFPSAFNHFGQGSLAWELDIWGRIRRANEAGLADLLAREENRRAVTLQIVGGVAQAYFDLRQFDMQLEISKRTLSAWEESVRIGQARLRQGMINKLDVDQFEAERENAVAQDCGDEAPNDSKRKRTQRIAGEESRSNCQGAIADRTNDAACGAGRSSLRTAPTPSGCRAGGATIGCSHRQDRDGESRTVSQTVAHGDPRCGESHPNGFCVAGNQFRSPCPSPDRPLVECPNARVSTAGRRSPSQTGCGPVRTNGSRRVQGG